MTEAEFRIALRADQTGLGLGEEVTIQTLQLGFEKQLLSRIHLMVRKNNSRGIRLYRRLGFRDWGECRKEMNGTVVDFWLMEILREEFSLLHAGILQEKEGVCRRYQEEH